VLLGLAADWLVFLGVFARLPREPVTWHSAAKAAIFAALYLVDDDVVGVAVDPGDTGQFDRDA
jgi:hypothetical protein